MSDASRDLSGSTKGRIGFWILLAALSCVRLTHIHLLWADEDYHLAAALNLLHGRIPYREFWYDKPPLCAAYYLLCAAYPRWPLRLLDAAYAFAACWLVFRIACRWWGDLEGRLAAFLFAFFLTFYLPSAVIPFAADALLILPHLAAIDQALRRRPFAAGVWCGVGFLFNVKAAFVLATCAAWLIDTPLLLTAGFLVPVLAALASALGAGAWSGYYRQVWQWGFVYAKDWPVANPAGLLLRRTFDWLGFHGALTAGAAYGFLRNTRKTVAASSAPPQQSGCSFPVGRRASAPFALARSIDVWKLGSWLVFSFVAVCVGGRFEPRYFLQLLPPMTLAAARGGAIAWREHRRRTAALAGVLLLVPLARFAPAYVLLSAADIRGTEPHWSDVALDLDSQRVARQIRTVAHPGDTLFVWGYRSDIYVYTRMISGSLFSDSQPLTGVPADRHLHASQPIYGGPAAQNRILLARTRPTFVVDGLGLLNPKLAPQNYPDLRSWLAGYQLIGRTKLSLIYRRRQAE